MYKCEIDIINLCQDFRFKIINFCVDVTSKLRQIISIFISIFIIFRNCKHFSFKYVFIIRFEWLLTIWFKFNDEKTIVQCECDDDDFRRFFFQCIIFFDVVHDVCENCIFRHRDAQCSHNEYVFFVESMNFSNKRIIRSIARLIIVETKNVFNYLIVKKKSFFRIHKFYNVNIDKFCFCFDVDDCFNNIVYFYFYDDNSNCHV